MPYLKVWVHLVWSTKNREHFLNDKIRKEVFQHIKNNAKEKDIYIDLINGYTDHVHCLVSLNQEQNISRIIKLLKGESSFWINKNKLTESKFEWQDEYFALSVSMSQLNAVKRYIKNQEKHHRKRSFKDEYDELIKRVGIN